MLSIRINVTSYVILTFFVCLLAFKPHSAIAQPAQLHVSGNHLADRHGKTVRLQGMDIPSLEWSSTGDHVLQSVDVALNDWHATIIRLPLSEDRWFGHAEDSQPVVNPSDAPGEPYRELVDKIVNQISSHNCYVLVDLHWSDCDQWGQHIGQHNLPDDNSVLFWKSAAARYKNNPAVFFDLYNEPHDVSWDVWQNGGTIDEHDYTAPNAPDLLYHSPGMQTILDTVRSTGAKNVCLAGGLDWGYDLSGIMNGHALVDQHSNGLMYGMHIYPQQQDWNVINNSVMAKYPVFVGECGCTPPDPNDPKAVQVDCSTWAPAVIAFINQHQLNWTAWSLHPTATPCLITGFDYQPTSYWGVYVKAALAGQNYTAPATVNVATPVVAPAAVQAATPMHQIIVWNGEDVTAGQSWVNPTTSTFAPETGDAHSGNTALEFAYNDKNIWIGGGYDWNSFKTGKIGTDTSSMKNLTFWIKSKGTAGDLQLQLLCNGDVLDTPEHHASKVRVAQYCPNFQDGKWHHVVIPLADMTQPVGYDPTLVTMIDFGFMATTQIKGSFLIDDLGFDDNAGEQST